MLVCDAWFDIVTSTPGERSRPSSQAVFAELPLAAICAYVVYDVERVHASVRTATAALTQLLEQAQPVLELRDAKLELVEIVARDEVQLVDERAHRAERLLGELRAAAAQPRGKLDEQLLDDRRRSGRYRARPCGLVRRRCRRFSRRACAPRLDGDAWIDVDELGRRLGGERLLRRLQRGGAGSTLRRLAGAADRRRDLVVAREPLPLRVLGLALLPAS